MKNPLRLIGEQFTDISRGLSWIVGNTLRSFSRGSMFSKPVFHNTQVTYDLARSLYRNQNEQFNLGAGFVRPVIDLCVEYIGLPHVTSDNDRRDSWLNECITDHWGQQLQEIFRDSMRDSKTILRFRQPNLTNPLMTEQDRMHGRIESVPPEFVDITYDPSDPDMIERAIFTHLIEHDERSDEEVQTGRPPRIVEHDVIEIITPQEYRWYDKTENRELVSWRSPNYWGFVPAWEIWNEYSADLGGGQSDIEAVMPFIEAFHQVLIDTLTAHKYHSIPKMKLNIKSLQQFLANNYPEVLDETGKLKPGAKINWTGREIMFLMPEEDADFVEAASVLGDSKTLLDFLIDCIAITSETPKWALLKEDATEKAGSVVPFEKKIERKRIMFGGAVIVMLCKMALKAAGEDPVTVRVMWHDVSLAKLAAKAQSIQQIVMGFDVAASHEWVADKTVVAILGSLFPEFSTPDIEMALAASNIIPIAPAPSPQSDTAGALPPAKKSTNGKVDKGKAQAALATTSASKS